MGCEAGKNQGNHSDNSGGGSKDVAVEVVRGVWVLATTWKYSLKNVQERSQG